MIQFLNAKWFDRLMAVPALKTAEVFSTSRNIAFALRAEVGPAAASCFRS